MNSILKLVVPCRAVRQVHQCIFTTVVPISSHPIPTRVSCISVRTMAQRSITSFFKVSPPKPVVKEEKVEDEETKVNGDEKIDSPVKNGKAKVITLVFTIIPFLCIRQYSKQSYKPYYVSQNCRIDNIFFFLGSIKETSAREQWEWLLS